MAVFCEWCKVGDFGGYCTCERQGDVCPLVRRCNTSHTWKPLDSMEHCTRRIKAPEKVTNIHLEKDEYRVLYVQRGKLYIDYNGSTLRIANPFEYEPVKVKLVRKDNELVIVTKEEEPEEDTKEVVEKVSTPKKKSNKKRKR